MKLQRLLIVLTVVNLGLLVFLLAQIRPVGAQETAPVLRTQKLEIVDQQGQVRGDFRVDDAPDGASLHMSDRNGRIRVKVGADSEGSGITLLSNGQLPGIQMKSDRRGSVITWTDNAGRAHAVQPN